MSYWEKPLKLTAKLGIVSEEEILERSRAWLSEGNSGETILQSALAAPIPHLGRILNSAASQTPDIAEVLQEELSSTENRPLLTEHVLTSELDGVLSFIELARHVAPETGQIVMDILKDEQNRQSIVGQAIVTPLGKLAPFLDFADGRMPELANSIWTGLANDTDALLKRAMATPLGQVSSFLDFADGRMPELAKSIRVGLANDPEALLNQALATPLDQLSSFFNYADRRMPELAKSIRVGLANDPDALLNQALATPLEHLASFLGYARTKMADAEKVLQSQLVTGVNLSRMADRAVHEGPEKITALCKHDRTYAQILAMIDVEKWTYRWRDSNFGQPNWFINFATSCYKQDRAVLVGPIAAALIQTARAEDFPSPAINIRHLAFVVTAPHGCTQDQVEQFLSRCFTSDWLGTQYCSPDASVGALAGAVRSIAMNEEAYIRRYFMHSAILRRLLSEQPKIRRNSRHLADWLTLFGAIRLLGHDEAVRLPMLDSRSICEALKIWPPGPVDQGIQMIQAGLWAGLREWCHISKQRLPVASDMATGILSQFRATDAVESPRVAALNAVMIDWLERCKDDGWNLVVDELSLLNALEYRLGFEAVGGTKT